MEHCSVLVQNISECLPNLNTPWTIPTDYSVKSPRARWIQAYVSFWMAPAFCIPGIAALGMVFGRHMPWVPPCCASCSRSQSILGTPPHQHAASPLHWGACRAILCGIQLRGSLPISFNKPKRALTQALLIKPLLSISILVPDGQTSPSASVQFPTPFSHPALFISSFFSFWHTKANAAWIDLLHAFSTMRLTSRSPLHNFIGPLCSLISSSFPD